MTTYSSVNAANFVAQNLGVNVQLGDLYLNTPYGNLGAVQTAMNYIGFQNIRDDVANGELSRMQTLAGYGFHFNIGRDPLWISDAEFQSRIDQLQSAHPGAITSVEGMNEVNGWTVNYAGLTGIPAAIAEQTWMHNALRADPLFANVPIYNFSLSSFNLSDYQALGNLSSIADVMPLHYYYGAGAPAGAWQTELGFAQAVTPNAAYHVFTEIGSSTATTDSWGTDETVQAKHTLDVAMDAARTNSRVFFYELADETHNNTYLENNYGLFHGDWTPKPAATALHNLTTILTAGADPNAAPDTFDYSVSGVQFQTWGIGYTTVFEKTANVHDIAVWAEPSLWNSTTHTEISNAPQPVTISLGATYDSVDIYDPLVGTASQQHLASVNSVTVSLVDHPLIIEVSNAPTGATTTGSTAPITTSSSPPTGTATESVSGWTNLNSDVIMVTASDNSGTGVKSVEIFDNGHDLGAATFSNTQWTFTAINLADGSHSFTAVVTDNLGDASAPISAGAAALVDTTAATTTIGESVWGWSNQTSEVIHGAASDGSGSGVKSVEIYDNGQDLGAATLNADGTWAYTVSGLQNATSHSYTALVMDNVGNSSQLYSAGAALNIDLIDPTVSIYSEHISRNHKNVSLSFSGGDTGGSGINHYVCWLDHNAQDSAIPGSGATTLSASSSSVSFSYAAVHGEYCHIAAVDNANNVSIFSNWLIT